MAAVLACGEGAVLSHEAAAGLWKVRRDRAGLITLSIPSGRRSAREGFRIHRRRAFEATRHHGIPVTTPVQTLIDLATILPPAELEAAVNEADRLDLVDPVALREELEGHRGERGVAGLRAILEQHRFFRTDSELERRFLPLAREAGLPAPLTQQWIAGLRVDFLWPRLGLVVETDGLRYHRTPSQQARDRMRDQRLVALGWTVLRFTHAQVFRDRRRVVATLRAVVRRLTSERGAANH